MESELMRDAGSADSDAPEPPGLTRAFGYEPNAVILQAMDLLPVEGNVPLISNEIVSKDTAAVEMTREEIPEPGFTSALLYEAIQPPTSTIEALSAHELPSQVLDCKSPAIANQPLEADPAYDDMVMSITSTNEASIIRDSKPELLEANAQDSSRIDHEEPEPGVSVVTLAASEASTKPKNESPAQEQTIETWDNSEGPAIQKDRAARAPSFFSSLRGTFAPEIQSAWSLVFGSRFEDDSAHADSTDSAGSADGNPSASVPANGRESLKARLARERRLDAQIQACQAKGRARTASATTKPEVDQSNQRARVSSALRKQHAPAPPKHVGLSLTRMRFCVERALRSTCVCFQDLYTRCMESDDQANQPPAASVIAGAVECGVFVTQFELERLLQSLSRDSCAVVHTELEHQTQQIPLTTLLQASWFLPFDHFSRLRSLVLQITRKHLNEQKLALLNRQLQRQILLQPLPVRLQQLLLQMSDPNADPTPAHFPLRPLLEAIAVSVDPAVVNFIPQLEFMELAPNELTQRLRISSVLTLQRVVFFRFLLAAMTTEQRRRTTYKPHTQHVKPKVDLRATQMRLKARRSTRKRRLKPPATSAPDDRSDSEKHDSVDLSSTVYSVVVTRGSLSPDNSVQKSKQRAEAPETDEDPREQQIRSLLLQLAAALGKMRSMNPWIEETNLAAQNLPLAPAIKATYVAASAFQQSIALMLSQKLPLDSDVEQKLLELVVSLSETLHRAKEPTPKKTHDRLSPSRTTVDPASAVYPRVPRATPSAFPPPYLDRPREPPDPIFPPVYASTRPSSWHFTPEFPDSPSSNQPPVQPAPLSTLKPPGVGSYDVQRSDQLRFSQTPSFSFAVDSPTSQSRPPSKKPSICKTSLARAVAIARSPAVPSSAPRVCETPEVEQDVDQQFQHALRLQQRLFMEQLVHDLVVSQPKQKPQKPSRGWKKTQSRLVNRIRQSVSVYADPEPLPDWAERKQPIASAETRQQKAKHKDQSSKAVTLVPPVSPQCDGEDPPDNDHLAWASRIRESYQQRNH